MISPIGRVMQNTGATMPVKSLKACVVYESIYGRVRHYHSVLTLVGGTEPSEAEIAKEALQAIYNRRNMCDAKLYVLHVPFELLQQKRRYRVDHANQTLILEAEETE